MDDGVVRAVGRQVAAAPGHMPDENGGEEVGLGRNKIGGIVCVFT